MYTPKPRKTTTISVHKMIVDIVFLIWMVLACAALMGGAAVVVGIIFSAGGAWSEVEGTVRDSFIDNYDRGTLVVDSNDGAVDVWYVTDETFANCDTGDLIHRVPDGTVTCTSQDEVLTGQ